MNSFHSFSFELFKGTKAIIKGSARGLQAVLTPAHYKEFVVGLAHAVKLGFEAMAGAEDLEDAIYCADHKVGTKLLTNLENKLDQDVRECAAQWKLFCDYYDKTSWDQLLETGAEFGTTLLLDTVVLNAAGWAATEGGKGEGTDN